MKLEATKDDLKVKEVVIKELQKRNNELLARLQQLTEMYSVVKRERSNKVGGLAICRWKWIRWNCVTNHFAFQISELAPIEMIPKKEVVELVQL